MSDPSSPSRTQPGTKRCPHCGASNPADAEWCGLCLERFTPKEAAAPAAPTAPSDAGAPPAPGASAAPAGATTTAGATGSTAFKKTEQGLVWVCSSCQTENPLEEQVCMVCGTSFAEVVRPKVERVQRDPGMAALVSLFFPGAGHAYLGMWGQAAARAVINLWALFVVLISVISKEQPGAGATALTFGLVSVGLWGVTAHDAYREARNEPNEAILRGRAFLYLVFGLLVLLMALLFSSGIRARG